MKKIHSVILAALCGTVFPLAAEVKLPAIFSNHAVLAKKSAVPVFGDASPGEKVTVRYGSIKCETVAGNDGKWRVELDLSNAPAKAQELCVNSIIIKDVIPGEVFLASGQSNMNFKLSRCENFSEIKNLPRESQLRFFIVKTQSSGTPQKNCVGKWVVFSPADAGQISGVAYYFARKLASELKTPVGIIQSTVGGTPIEAWMSRESLRPFPGVVRLGQKNADRLNSYPERYRQFTIANDAWVKKAQRTDTPHRLPPADVRWRPLTGKKIAGDGIVWMKHALTITPQMAKNGFSVILNRVTAPTSLWIDGNRVMNFVSQAYQNKIVRARVPAGKFTAGKRTLYLRFYAPRSSMAFRVYPYIPGNSSLKRWQVYREKDFAPLSAALKKSRPALPGAEPAAPRLRWSGLYNGMIHPLKPYGLSGIIWYQGESNSSRAWDYTQLFPAMIKDYRKQFENENLPFFFVLLAPYKAKSDDAGAAGWGDIRWAQMRALDLPHTGMAVISDAGEAADIHPLDKAAPGERLALQALKKVYSRNVDCDSPLATHAKVAKGGKVTVFFAHTSGGLQAKPVPPTHHLNKSAGRVGPLKRNSPEAQLEGFALCGNDGKWHWADQAEITAPDAVTLRAKAVPEPVKVRAYWSDNPTCNLFNRAGLPAAPFELRLR